MTTQCQQEPSLEDLYRALGRVEGKLDAALAQSKRIDDVEDRQDALERKHAWFTGVGSMIVFVATLFSGFWDTLFKGH